MPTREQITFVIEDYVASVGRQDLEGVLALFSADARQEDPIGGPVNEGEAIRGFFEKSFRSSFTTVLDEVLVNGDHAAFRFTITLPTEADPIVIRVIDLIHVNADLHIDHLQALPDFGA